MTIATSLGWHPGVRSDYTVYPCARPLYFLDIEYKDPDWPAHVAVAGAERPYLAAVADIMQVVDVPLALERAAQIAPFCERVLLIPKKQGVIARLPRHVLSKPVVLGYSVPSRYGASPVPIWEYKEWPVHLLGGTPLRQLEIASYLRIVSADGNVCQRVAHLGAAITETGGRAMLADYEPGAVGSAIPRHALALSLTHIGRMWERAGFSIEPRGVLV